MRRFIAFIFMGLVVVPVLLLGSERAASAVEPDATTAAVVPGERLRGVGSLAVNQAGLLGAFGDLPAICDVPAFANVGICTGGGRNTAPEPAPTPEPTPAPDYGQLKSIAYDRAVTDLDDGISEPQMRLWPAVDNFQVVNLDTYLYVESGWDTITGRGEACDSYTPTACVTVSFSAEPEHAQWSFVEDNGFNPPVEFECDRGERQPDDLDGSPSCGKVWTNSSDVTGDVTAEVTVSYKVTVTTSHPAYRSYLDVSFDVESPEPDEETLTVVEVQTYLSSGNTPLPEDPEDEDLCERFTLICSTLDEIDYPDDDDGNPYPSGLPVKTETCSVWGEVGAGILIVDLDTGLGFEIIIETYADGTQVVTIAGDVGAAVGTDVPSLGAAITVNDSTLGAYYKAEASAWGTIGAGAEYVLAPGESVQDLLIDIAIDTGTGFGGEIINDIGGLFGQQPIPEAPPADAIFVDVSIWGEAEASATLGAGQIQAAVGANGQVGVNVAGKEYADGRYSIITTFFGDINGQFASHIGEDGIEISGQAVGQFQVETIFDGDGNMIEAIVTTSYGWDGDVLVDDEEDDAFTVTNQTWSIDLTDPEAQDAFITDLNIPGMLDEYGVTDGPQEFTVEDNTTTIAISADIIAAEAGGKLEFGCTTVS